MRELKTTTHATFDDVYSSLNETKVYRTIVTERTLLRYDEVDDHGGAAGEGGLGPDVEVVHRLGAHERHLSRRSLPFYNGHKKSILNQ